MLISTVKLMTKTLHDNLTIYEGVYFFPLGSFRCIISPKSEDQFSV